MVQILPKDMSTCDKLNNTLLNEEWSIRYTPTPSKYVVCHLDCMVSTNNFHIKCWRSSPCSLIENGKMHATSIMVYHGRMPSWWRASSGCFKILSFPTLSPSLWLFSPHLPPSTCSFLLVYLTNSIIETLCTTSWSSPLSLCLCAFEFFSLPKACVCCIELHYHVLLLLVIQLHHQ